MPGRGEKCFSTFCVSVVGSSMSKLLTYLMSQINDLFSQNFDVVSQNKDLFS